MKLNIVMRTCDKHSLQSKRIVNKKECILRCLNSILTNLDIIPDKSLHIIDDDSSSYFRQILFDMTADKRYVSIEYLAGREHEGKDPRKKTRYSFGRALEYIYKLPENELVYLVEDDYLHFPFAIIEMVDTWKYFRQIMPIFDIGIFPQDFNQLYLHPTFPYNDTYFRSCVVVPTPMRYYRTTWYTQESFMVETNIYKKYQKEFDSLLEIGDDNGYNWEGNTVSKIWERPDFKMFMPMSSLVIHMSNQYDIPFHITRDSVVNLWEQNKTPWSSVPDSQVQQWQESWPREALIP